LQYLVSVLLFLHHIPLVIGQVATIIYFESPQQLLLHLYEISDSLMINDLNVSPLKVTQSFCKL
jgi:hypothetical protein